MSPVVLTILFSCASAFVTLVSLGFLAMCAPNAAAPYLAGLRNLGFLCGISAVVGIAGGIVLLSVRQQALAVTLSMIPIQACVLAFFILWEMGKVQVDAGAMPSVTNIVVRSLVLLVFGGGGIVLFFVGAREHAYQRTLLASAGPVSAVVVESKVTASKSQNTRPPGDLRDNSTTTYSPDIKFRYRIGDQEYESELLRPSAIVRTYASAESAQAELAAFPQGAVVTAYVNPALPEKGFLVREKSGGPVVFLILGFVLPTIALFGGKLV